MKRIFSLFLTLVLVLGLCACGQKAAEGPTWQEQYDLGIKYLEEGNYEEAIIAFTAAIEIDPKRPEAYVGLAKVYTAQGDPEKAAEVLTQGEEDCGESDVLASAWKELGLSKGTENQNTSVVTRTKRKERKNGGYVVGEYDGNDNLVHFIGYNDDGVMTDEGKYSYDEQGRVVELWHGSEERQSTFTFAYDGAEVTARLDYQKGSSTGSFTMHYTMVDTSNRLDSGWFRWSDDGVFLVEIRELGDNGVVARAYYDGSGKLLSEER